MPTAKKTKSGKWRVQVYDYTDSTGKQHLKTFTAETKREAERMAREYKDAGSALSDITVAEAMKSYIKSRKAVVSPATHRAYQSIFQTHFEKTKMGSLKLSSLRTITIQIFVSELTADGKSPKTVRNIYGVFSASVKMFRPDLTFQVTLPAQKKPELHTPTTKEIEKLISSIKNDHDLYICILLCAFGPMRRSEACAVRYDDIIGNKITVRRSRVYNADSHWVYKDMPKTYSSYRTIEYPQKVIDAIGKGIGYLITESSPQALTKRFTVALVNVGLPHFRLHDLRHYAASILHAIGIPDQYIMARGGWRTDTCMKRVYRDTISDVEKEMNQKVTDYFEQNLNPDLNLTKKEPAV